MFGKKKNKVKGDEATQFLMKQGAYNIQHHPHPFVMDHETVKKKKIYNFWSGLKYTVILSVLLFWIPPFGQMVAGYVGGRKAGTPMKGLFAALIPVSVLFILFGLTSIGIFSDQIGWFFSLPETGATFVSGIPIFGTIAEFSTDYIIKFSESLGFGGPWLTPYILTIIFGYVGGIMSLQHQKEMEESGTPGVGGTQPTIVPVPVLPQVQTPVQPTHPQAPITPQANRPQEGDVPIVMGKKPEGWEEEK